MKMSNTPVVGKFMKREEFNANKDKILEFYKEYLPLYDLGLGWILPAALGALVGALYGQLRKGREK